jgi:hypothetical protein
MSIDRRISWTLVLAACAGAIALGSARGIDILVPGMSLRSVSLVPGARVSYLVKSESFGAADSSFIELRVLEPRNGSHRLEIVSAPYPRSKETSVTIRLRLEERVTSASSPAEFRSCLKEILIKEGRNAFRAATSAEMEDLDIEAIFIRTDDSAPRTPLGSARISTPAGVYLCDGVEVSRKDTRSVRLGGVQAQRLEEETSRAWTSKDVPLWGLVKSTVEKKTLTKIPGAVARVERPRVTVTESTLLSCTRPRGRS